MWKLAFFALICTECSFRAKAMGICKFAAQFPLEDNDGSTCFKTAGLKSQMCENKEVSSTTIAKDPLYKDCYDVYKAGHTQNDVYSILPIGWPGSPFYVYCDMTTSGGGWTVFQRRIDRTTDFYRNWTSYKNGFGVLEYGNDFWLGNEKLYFLTNTNQRSYKLRVDIVTADGRAKYDEYEFFRIGSENTKYRLVNIDRSSGTAGNGMQYSRGHLFSTHDSDNDQCNNQNCAMRHKGAWWYAPSKVGRNYCLLCDHNINCDQFNGGGCGKVCSKSNLNGDYSGYKGENIYWSFSTFCNIRSAEMKIRPYPLGG